MSTITENLKLTKPELGDNINPEIFAENFDAIDKAIGDINVNLNSIFDKLGTLNFNTVNNNINNLTSRISSAERTLTDTRTTLNSVSGRVNSLATFTNNVNAKLDGVNNTVSNNCLQRINKYIPEIYGTNDANVVKDNITCESNTSTANIPPGEDGWGVLFAVFLDHDKGFQFFWGYNNKSLHFRGYFKTAGFSEWGSLY